MKEKAILFKSRAENFALRDGARNLMLKASPVVLSVSVAMASNPMIFADDATGLMETIIKILANLILALAVIMGIIGLVNYASAHSEGDGPAQSKAIGKIAAAVMLIALSLILKANVSEFSKYISTDI